MGRVFQELGEYEKAYEYYRNALEIKERAFGPDHPAVASSLSALGSVFLKKGEFNKALEYFQKALSIWETALGTAHPILAWPLSSIGNVYLEQGKPRQALVPLERVVKSICEEKTCDSYPHGSALFGLARALVTTGQDKKRALKLAKEAWVLFGNAPKKFKKQIEQVDAWMKKQ